MNRIAVNYFLYKIIPYDLWRFKRAIKSQEKRVRVKTVVSNKGADNTRADRLASCLLCGL